MSTIHSNNLTGLYESILTKQLKEVDYVYQRPLMWLYLVLWGKHHKTFQHCQIFK